MMTGASPSSSLTSGGGSDIFKNPFAKGGGGFSSMVGGIGQLLNGLFGDSGSPYAAAGDEFNKWMQQAMQYMDPFYKQGLDVMPEYKNALMRMKDPQAYIKDIMGGYSQSPFATNQIKQGQLAQQNAASASGMLGSSDLMKQSADYTQDLSSKDMQQYLNNVLGVNDKYMSGLSGLEGMGFNAGSSMVGMLQKLAEAMGGMKFGQEQGKGNDMSDIFGGGLSILSKFL